MAKTQAVGVCGQSASIRNLLHVANALASERRPDGQTQVIARVATGFNERRPAGVSRQLQWVRWVFAGGGGVL